MAVPVAPTVDLVLPLHGLTRAAHACVGSKAANLGALLHAGLPVPPGLCVTTAAYHLFLSASGLTPADLNALGSVDAVARAGAVDRVRTALAATRMPAVVVAAISAAWQTHWAGRPDTPLAVRSSATAEDLPRASFAGQQDTLLDVRGLDAVLQAVRACWLSLFTPRAVSYRATHGGGGASPAMAVIVQELVPAEAAGVLFTADPARRDRRRIIIEATAGLGAALVAGQVTPHRWTLQRPSLRTLARECAPAVPPCLRDGQVQALARLALRAEACFAGPQDIEWALAGGTFHLLQARPITTPVDAPPRERSTAEPTIWTNANVGELLPDVATPMTWSVLRLSVDALFGSLLRRFGLDLQREPWIDLVAGRVYANVSVFERALGGLPGFTRISLDHAFGGHQGTTPAVWRQRRARRAWRPRLRVLVGMPRVLGWFVCYALPHRARRAAAAFAAQARALAEQDVARQSDAELAGVHTLIASATFRLATRVLPHAAIAMSLTTLLFRCTRRWLGDDSGAVANRLLSQTGGMASAAAARALWQVAEAARADAQVTALICSGAPYAQICSQLVAAPGGTAFLAAWEQWSRQHGHHTSGELDVARPRWSESPDYVLGLLRTYLATPPDASPVRQQARRQAERATLLAECRRQLGPLRRAVFDRLVRWAPAGLVLREDFKSDAIRVIAVVRRALVELGRRLAQRGVLTSPDDVFFLLVEELEPLVRNGPPADLRARLTRRRAEFAYFQQLTPPPVIVGDFDPAQAAPPPAAPSGDFPRVLRGLPVSAGVATGPARVILAPGRGDEMQPGEVLIAPCTDPGWAPYFLTAAGIVVDMGGLLSHGSIVAREYGLPAVVNVGPATRLIRTGQLVRVDGDHGTVTLL